MLSGWVKLKQETACKLLFPNLGLSNADQLTGLQPELRTLSAAGRHMPAGQRRLVDELLPCPQSSTPQCSNGCTSICSVPVTGGAYLLGRDGWRVVFYTVAAVSAAVGALTVVGGRDPLYLASGRRERRLEGGLAALRGEVWQLLTTPTFCVLIAQVSSAGFRWVSICFLVSKISVSFAYI